MNSDFGKKNDPIFFKCLAMVSTLSKHTWPKIFLSKFWLWCHFIHANVVKTLAMLCIPFKCTWFMMYPIEP